MTDLMERLQDVFREVFDDDALEIRDETVAGDVDEWDSLNHVKLVVAIEESFGVQFANREIAAWENVGDMRKALVAKLSA
jgi:acyl carrier protein